MQSAKSVSTVSAVKGDSSFSTRKAAKGDSEFSTLTAAKGRGKGAGILAGGGGDGNDGGSSLRIDNVQSDPVAAVDMKAQRRRSLLSQMTGV